MRACEPRALCFCGCVLYVKCTGPTFPLFQVLSIFPNHTPHNTARSLLALAPLPLLLLAHGRSRMSDIELRLDDESLKKSPEEVFDLLEKLGEG